MRHSPEEQLIHTVAAAGEPFGLALAGVRGLRRHGLSDRDGDGVDFALAARDAGRLTAARTAIAAALTEQGCRVSVDGRATGKAFVRMNVRRAGTGHGTPLTLHVAPRTHEPAVVAGVPVLHPDDLAAAKVVTLVLRSEVRDVFDVFALADRYDPDRLIDLALAHDPELRAEDFLTAFKHVTEREEVEFTRFGAPAARVAAVRAWFQERFTELSARHSRPIAAALDPKVLAGLAALAQSTEPAAPTERPSGDGPG
ncbi:nucleotidyl transferase AbiEii/AbiGii toxin family protein [Embleya sp. NPDC008237]|uniref:nucleotidyl transferase AbiEii/AbiGii toxin family protein n=1 Tax=Embleya sp. NPDC008237 TaxID=3363978 RepID=UPI0036EE26BF